MATTPEGKVKAKVKKLLGTYDKLYHFMPVPMQYQASSLDYFVCYCGRFIAIETKREGEDLTNMQKLIRRRIEEAGGTVFRVSNDEELFALKTFLDNLY